MRTTWIAIIATASITTLQGQDRTRTEEILAQRAEKQQNLREEAQSSMERRLDWVKDTGLERFTEGWNGIRAKIGGLAPGGGLAFGPEYSRSGLAGGRIDFRAGFQTSPRGYQKQDIHVALPGFLTRRMKVDLYGVRHNYPGLNYYGSGPDSERAGRSAFRLEDTAFDAAVTFELSSRLRAGGGAGYLFNNVGRGTDARFVSSEEIYSVPGFDTQSNFSRVGAFVQYDYRDFAPGPRSGGNYVAQFHHFTDRTLGRFSFHRLDLEAQQYVPLFNKRRVIALRAKSITSFTGNGETLPFYMQPMLGGSDDLRGYRPFRFRGNNLLLMNAEYRWEVFSGMDMAVFTDAGKVYQQRSQINLRNLESNVGFGFRFNARNMTFMRIDVGFSHEGYQVSVKFNDLFRRGPVHTSSTQGDF
jgi:outer membrane protein assembly factor BamA